MGLFLLSLNQLAGQSAADGAEGIVNLLAEDGHNGNHHNRDEGENDGVFDETLAFFFECKQHGSNSFLIKKFDFFPEEHPQNFA
jgi:hypothetical protein